MILLILHQTTLMKTLLREIWHSHSAAENFNRTPCTVVTVPGQQVASVSLKEKLPT